MKVLVTGATGFVGGRLVPRLAACGHDVVAYARRWPDVPARHSAVIGDITDVGALGLAMTGVDVVLHLAATTGKASPAAHHATIVEGTRAVMTASARAGVRHVVAVSSIAAGFADLRDYPYAQAKRAAEDVIRAGAVPAAIVRPTAIFGDGSPVQRALARLAGLPVVPVIGPGTTRLQPVHVDDVADALADAVEDPPPFDQTVDLGGPEAIAVDTLLRRLRAAAGHRRGLLLHLPAPIVLGPLRLAEAAGLGAVLPVSAGQFSSFVHDGVARPHPWTAARIGRFRSLDAMLTRAPAADVADPPLDREALAYECAVFGAHVLGTPPSPTLVEAYVRAHETSRRFRAESPFDDRLVRVARRHPALARLADAYGCLAAPAGLLRRKLILLLAIAETSPEHYRAIDAPLARSAAATILQLGLRGFGAAVVAVVALACLAPLHLASGRKRPV